MYYKELLARFVEAVERGVSLLERGAIALEQITASLPEKEHAEPVETFLNREGEVWFGDDSIGKLDNVDNYRGSEVWGRLTGRQTREYLRDTAGIDIFPTPNTLSVISVARVRQAVKYVVGDIMQAQDRAVVQGWLDDIKKLVDMHLQQQAS